ncbi:RlmE family RNA methyltransferase [Candidatus Halobeggiatoa sp. HSG11]|nr:RlmE family RNA methyltransferase [Candidatus Halobeggiatoa sp. HSG11]
MGNQWLNRHNSDIYVKQSRLDGYRSRAVYKLAQIDARDHLLTGNMNVIDLGAAPGGWSQWIAKNKQIKVFALDILPMEPLINVTFIQGDFREDEVLNKLLEQLGGCKIDLVISDMAPNTSGIKDVDQARSMLLAELARDFAYEVLTQNGNFLTKVFQGEGFDFYIKSLRQQFKKVVTRKPDASRAKSPEVYLVGKNYLGNSN